MELTSRQHEIIDTALNLIHEQGIQELTMKRIAGVIGVSEPALYRHFGSKAEILSAVVDQLDQTRRNATTNFEALGDDPEARLKAFFELHARQFADRPALMAVLFSDDIFLHDQGLSQRVAAIISGSRNLIKGEVERGKETGDFRADIDCDTVAFMLSGGFRLLVATWRLEKMAFDLMDRSALFIDHALALIRVPR